MKNLQTDTCGLGAADKKKQATSRPDCLWPEIWSGLSKAAQRKVKQHWAVDNDEARQC